MTGRSMKRTKWLSSRVNPVHVGVYEVRIQNEDGTAYFRRMRWNGKRWLGILFHDDSWRGLREGPK